MSLTNDIFYEQLHDVLLKPDFDELLEFTATEFIEKVRPFFLTEADMNLIDEFSNIDSKRINSELKFYLTLSAFAYRHTTFFHDYLEEYKVEKQKYDEHEAKRISKQTLKSKSKFTDFLDILGELQIPYPNHLNNIVNEAKEFHYIYMKAKGEDTQGINKPQRQKQERKFFKIHLATTRNKSLQIKEKIYSEFNLKVGDNSEFERLKQAFYRWRKKEFYWGDYWPTPAFVEFIYFISVIKVISANNRPIDPIASYTKIDINSDIKINELLKVAKYLSAKLYDENDNMARTKFIRAEKEKHYSTQYSIMKKLALESNIYALKYIKKEFLSPHRDKAVIQLAMLGDNECAKELNWKALGFHGICFSVANNHSRLRLTYNLWQSFQSVPAKTMVDKFSFHINLSLIEVHPPLRRICRISAPKIVPFVHDEKKKITYIDEYFRHVTILATLSNFNIMMKHADILPNSMSIIFATGVEAYVTLEQLI